MPANRPSVELEALSRLPIEEQVALLARENERRYEEIQRLTDQIERLTEILQRSVASRGPLFASAITPEMVERATAALVAVHDEEARAYLNGEIEANVWRPERYAEAAVRAAFRDSQANEGD